MAEIELNRREAADGELPPVCIYCGAPATAYRNKVFFGTTPFRRFWFQRPRVALPVCARHRSYSLRRSLLLLPSLVAFLAVLALLAQLTGKGPVPGALAALLPFKGALVGLALGLFFALLGTVFFLFYTDIRCTRLTRTSIMLANVSARFVEAYDFGDEAMIEEVLPAHSPSPAARRRTARAASPARPPGSGTMWILLGAGAFLFCLVGGLVGVFWLADGLTGGKPIVISNPQYTRGLIVNSLQVQYRFRRAGPVADAAYVLVVRPARGQAERRVYPGRQLHPSGTLQIDLLAPPFGRPGLGGGPEGPFEIFVEVEPAQPGAPPERGSNVLTVR